MANAFGAVALLGYGLYGLVVDDFWIPRRRGAAMHLSGMPAWLFFAAIAFAAISMIAVVVDHYDRRDNERHYAIGIQLCQAAAALCFILSLLMHHLHRV